MSSNLALLQQLGAGVWDYVSPSRLNLWAKCPLAFKLRYVDGIVPPTPPSMFLGKMVHTGLEIYYRHHQLGITLGAQDISNRLKNLWSEAVETDVVSFKSADQEQATKKQAVDLVAAYLDHVQDEEPQVLAVEPRLEAPLVDPDTGEDLGISLVGILDLVVDEPAGPLITDFKTASRGGRTPDVQNEIQLSSYAYLFRHASQRQEGAMEIRSLIKTKTPRVEIHRHEGRTDAHFRRLFSLIRAYLDDLDAGRFVFRPGLECSFCEFRETHCAQWLGLGRNGPSWHDAKVQAALLSH